MRRLLPSVQVLAELYSQLGSVHRVGEAIGFCGDKVHRKLRASGFSFRISKWSPVEIEELKGYYRDTPAENFDIGILAQRLGRPYAGVALKASKIGLTVRGRVPSASSRAKISVSQRKRFSTHPQPNIGRKFGPHTQEWREMASRSSKRMWDLHKRSGTGLASEAQRIRRARQMSARQAAGNLRNGFSLGAQGKRADMGELFFRSSWEANIARYLNLLVGSGEIQSWKYESERFRFRDRVDAPLSYRPDFVVWRTGASKPEYWEVKGWMYPRGAISLELMALQYPEIQIVLIDQVRYREIEREFSASIAHWERKGKSKRQPATQEDAT